MFVNYFYLLKTTWKHAGEQRKSLVIAYTMMVFAYSLTMLKPLFLGLVINAIQVGGERMVGNIVLWLGLYALIVPVFWLLHGSARVMEMRIGYFVVKDFQETMYSTLAQKPLQWHRSHHSGDTIDRIKKATRALKDFSEGNFDNISSAIEWIVSLIVFFLFAPLFGFIALLFSLIMYQVIKTFDAKLTKGFEAINSIEHTTAATLHDYITNMFTVISLRLEKLTKGEISNQLEKILPVLRPNSKWNELKWCTVDVLLIIMQIIIIGIWVGMRLSSAETIMLGTTAMLFQYLQRLNQVFFFMAGKMEQLVKQGTDLNSVAMFVPEHIEIKDSHTRQTSWKTIHIQKLNFTYEDQEGEMQHLEDVAITLERGKRIALVGESGCGKSTLLTALRGLITPEQVEVLRDRNQATSLQSLATTATLIPQDPEIFDNTIAYNITAGLQYEENNLLRVIDLACFSSVVRRLPKGIATSIRERGVNLSGGEKQRLALARGIFAAEHSQSTLLLLDEPTSSVDPVNEGQIYNNLFTHFADLCIVSSIHRLHLLGMFDYIYVLVRGKIVEEGTFSLLRSKRNGVLVGMLEQYKESNS